MDDISRASTGERRAKPRRRRAKGPVVGAEDRMVVEAPEVVEVPEDVEAPEVAETDEVVEAVVVTEAVEVAEPEPEVAAEPAEAREVGDEELPELKDPAELARVLMAVLLVAREPVSKLRLAQVSKSSQEEVVAALELLQQNLSESGLPIEVNLLDESARLLTLPDVFPYLSRFKGVKKAERLSPAALETLAVVAYRQPVIRAEIEAIRGVKVGPTLRTLLDHKLVDVEGRSEDPGRPLQYGTTQHFLDRFGLKSVKDLPSVKEFRSL